MRISIKSSFNYPISEVIASRRAPIRGSISTICIGKSIGGMRLCQGAALGMHHIRTILFSQYNLL